MRTIPVVLVAAALALVSGCAQSDWIERTLVTVDVTGICQSAEGGLLQLELAQQGSRVRGSILMQGVQGVNSISGPIDGTLAGDVLSFRQAEGGFAGQVTVSGEEMKGQGRVLTGQGRMAGTISILLQRVNSSPRPPSQQP